MLSDTECQVTQQGLENSGCHGMKSDLFLLAKYVTCSCLEQGHRPLNYEGEECGEGGFQKHLAKDSLI